MKNDPPQEPGQKGPLNGKHTDKGINKAEALRTNKQLRILLQHPYTSSGFQSGSSSGFSSGFQSGFQSGFDIGSAGGCEGMPVGDFYAEGKKMPIWLK